MLRQLVERIRSLEKEMVALREETEENRRSSCNIIRLGIVDSASEKTVDVVSGDNKATRIPFFVHCAGRVTHYRRPSAGEQCILINLGSGDNLNNSVALMGLPSTQYPCPTTEENQVMTDYGDGMTELYDLDKGSLTVAYPGGVLLKADIVQEGNLSVSGEVSDGVRSMRDDREIYNGHVHPHGEPNTGNTEQKQ
ncbi:phage baseplate assembly protein V [Photobacterium damselae]